MKLVDLRCANRSSEPQGEKCTKPQVKGHIYCNECRIANGGYNRHNPLPRKGA
jgi:hypothetical protein